MHTALTKKIATFTAIQYLLMAVATLLVSFYYSPEPDMPHTTIVNFGVIANGLQNVTLISIMEALNDLPVQVGLIILLLSFVGLRLAQKNRLKMAGFLFFSQGTLLLGAFGWLGLLALPILIFTDQPMDGEVLGEHWPQLIANGLSALIAFYLARSCRKKRVSLLSLIGWGSSGEDENED